jgi:peptidoglycan biosynthesis protein MviN/MurJ (putative lipid II flippase)
MPRKVSTINTPLFGVIAFTFLSPASGLGLEVVLARLFGASAVMDSFRVSATVIALSMSLLFSQVIPHFLVPRLACMKHNAGAFAAWHFTRRISAPWVPTALLIWFFGEYPAALTLRLLAPGLSPVDHSASLTMMEAALTSVPLIVLAAIFSSALQVFNIVWPSTVAPILLSVPMLFWLLAAPNGSAHRTLSLGIIGSSLVLATFMFCAVILLIAPDSFARSDPSSEGKRHKSGLLPALVLMAASTQISTILLSRQLSVLGEGALAIYGYAFKLTGVCHLPALAFNAVTFTVLASSALTLPHEEWAHSAWRSVRTTLSLTIPTVAILWSVTEIAVPLAYGSSGISGTNLTQMSSALKVMLLGAPFAVLSSLLVKMLAVSTRSGSLILGGLASPVVCVTFLPSLSSAWQIEGVAGTWSLAMLVQTLLLAFLNVRLSILPGIITWFRVCAPLFSAGAVTVAVAYFSNVVLLSTSASSLSAFSKVGICALLCTTVFLVFAHLLGCQDLIAMYRSSRSWFVRYSARPSAQ